jgi:hypothetical protein
MFQRKILRGLMLAVVLALVPSLAVADPCDPPVQPLASDTHDVGTIELQIDDDGGSGWNHLVWPAGTDHMHSACLMVGNSATDVLDGCS